VFCLKTKSEDFAVRLIPLATSCLLIIGLISACAQSEFAGDTGQGVRNGMKDPNKDPNNPDDPTNNTPGNDDGLKTDDGGKIEIIETTLTIKSNSDRAKFKNCVSARLTNLPQEPAKQLGCNRSAPYGGKLDRQSAKMKVQTNTCNVMNISFTSQNQSGTRTLSTNANSSRFIIKRTGPNSFNVQANDNDDNDWRDLDLDIIGDGSFKFTIESQGGCQ
jgi:hypothetical protein